MARTRCDVTDEAVFEASPGEVWSALMAEHNGQSHWWEPFWEAHPRGDTPATTGSEIAFLVHPGGEHLRFLNTHFTGRVTDMVEDRLARAEFVGGDLRGIGEWILEPVPGGTRLRMHFRAHAHGLRANLLDLAFNLGKEPFPRRSDGIRGASAAVGGGGRHGWTVLDG